ncbi:MAG: arginase [Pseudomonadota bacterium]
MKCALLGLPMQDGTDIPGCVMGPDALRTAGITEALRDLGHSVQDLGNLSRPLPQPLPPHDNSALRNLGSVSAWTQSITQAAYEAAKHAEPPIFLGGDHSVSAGTIQAMSKRAAEQSQAQFVLWLDAHPDLHRLETTRSGNLHGTPLAYALGLTSYSNQTASDALIAAENVCLMGLRSVDPAERQIISDLRLDAHDMRAIDEHGISKPLKAFLQRVSKANGRLHVSFDVDFLDPEIACAVGTTVPGGASFREAHLVMELLHESGLVTSLDLVELNPALDERGKTARLMVDLTASLLGRTILDRPTWQF